MTAAVQMLLAEGAAWSGAKALVSHVSARSPDSTGFTTGAIDTTGANLLIAHMGNYATAGAGYPASEPVTDSKGNTWTALTIHPAPSGGNVSRIWYAKNATVGSGHTFTASGNGLYPALCVAAFSGADTASPFDVENGGAGASGSPPQSIGSITPTLNGELIIAGMSEYTSFVGTFSINAGMTVIEDQLFRSGQNFGSRLAYLIQGGKAAINPAWNWTSGGDQRAYSIAAFK